MFKKKRKHQILIRYKSGNEQVVTCTKFTIKYMDGKLASITWDNLKPDPIFIGIRDIESIWELR